MLDSHSSEVLEDLDSWVDGHSPDSSDQAMKAALESSPELAEEARSLRQLGEILLSSRVDVQDDFAVRVLASLSAETAEDERFAGFLEGERIDVRPGFAESVHQAALDEVDAPDSVAAMLDAARVPVRAGFADGVMKAALGEVPANDADTSRKWTQIGIACAAALALISAAIVGVTGDSGLGLLGMVGDIGAMALLAGGGMLGATWSGVGAAVDAWLGASALSWSVALMVTAGLVFLCARSVRRQRVRVDRD